MKVANIAVSIILGLVTGYLLLYCSGKIGVGNSLAKVVVLNEWFLLNLDSLLEDPKLVMSVLSWVKNIIWALPISLLFGLVLGLALKNKINNRIYIYASLLPLLILYIFLAPALTKGLGYDPDPIVQAKIRYSIFSGFVPLFIEFVIFYLLANKWNISQKIYNK